MSNSKTSNQPSIVKHLLDRDKIFTGELDPKRVESTKSLEYEKNVKGSFIVDQNTNLENRRRLLSLYTEHTTQKDFVDVVDTEFVEFVEEIVPLPVVDDTRLEDLSADNLTLQRKIDRLNNQVSELEENIKRFNSAIAQPSPPRVRAQVPNIVSAAINATQPVASTPTPTEILIAAGVTPGNYLARLKEPSTLFKNALTGQLVEVLDKPSPIGIGNIASSAGALVITINPDATVLFRPRTWQIVGTPEQFNVTGPFVAQQWVLAGRA